MHVFSALFHYFHTVDQEKDAPDIYVHMKDDSQAILSQVSWEPGERIANCGDVIYHDGRIEEGNYGEIVVGEVVWGKIIDLSESLHIKNKWRYWNLIKKANRRSFPKSYAYLDQFDEVRDYTKEHLIVETLLSQEYGNKKEHIKNLEGVLMQMVRISDKDMRRVIREIAEAVSEDKKSLTHNYTPPNLT